MKIRLLAIIALVGMSSVNAEVEDNAGYAALYNTTSGVHLTLLPSSFVPGPVGTAVDFIAISLDASLKFMQPTLIAPSPSPVLPTSADQCTHQFTLNQDSAIFENLLGVADISDPLPAWGSLGTPVIGHANSEVEVRALSTHLDGWSETSRLVSFPAGNHSILWEAATQLSPIGDIVIPYGLFYITNETKYGKAIFDLQTDPKTAARAVEIGLLFLISAAIDVGLIAADEIVDDSSIGGLLTVDTQVHRQFRTFTVLDTVPPTVTTTLPNPAPLEATDLGGERWDRHDDFFRGTIIASDPCGLPVTLSNDAPVLLQIGDNPITWTVTDPRQVGGGNPGFDTLIQNVIVQDTRAPLLLAPPSRVVEANAPITPSDFDVGTAVVFDLADPEPLVENDVPTTFPVNARTQIQWTATDGSGNVAERSQWVTVKTPGTNTSPTATSTAASTLTSVPVDILLQGSDSDFLSGRFDPLQFRISTAPANGFFVAPLTPYFIEDYRVRPTTQVGNILANATNAAADLDAAFCDQGMDIPVDFVYEPKAVQITDTGESYVLDRRWSCGSGLPTTSPRVGKWSETGELLLERTDIATSVERIVIDGDGNLNVITPEGGDGHLTLRVFDPVTLDSMPIVKVGNGVGGRGRFNSAVFDPLSGIIYATDKEGVFAFDSNDVSSNNAAYLGKLNGGVDFMSGQNALGSNDGYVMDVDSTGALYVTDSAQDRIHKFEASDVDMGSFLPGAYVGWLGRCDSGPNCDDEEQTSIGFSCTDSACSVNQTAGAATSQFDLPWSIAIDAKDILYVTDYENFRVQRFSPLGDFAGEAKSTCDGTCFVLGDMGRPQDIAVNATQFFVLDRDRALMHVFETAPFKDIMEDSVIVSYASDNDFQGTDSFQFQSFDGLVRSAPATVTIDVARNFRAPEALDVAVAVDEDDSVAVELLARDPDGILGVDFNGLDTLTYGIVQGPEHGTLIGSGPMRTYTPNPDFTGPDAFTFVANDGVDISNIATVSITVNEVNDPPVVRLTDESSKIIPKKLWPLLKGKVVSGATDAPLGFAVPLMAEFDDPDEGQAHFVQIAWGDGTIDSGNQSAPTDENDDDPTVSRTVFGTGQVLARHTYLTEGAFPVDVEVFDSEAASGALSTSINVVPMIDLTLEAVPASDPLPGPGSVTSLIVELVNQVPQSPVVGMDATNVAFTATLPDGVAFVSVNADTAGCTHLDSVTTCTLASMANGQSEMITLTVMPDVNFDPGEAAYVLDVTASESDASADNFTPVAIPVLPQRLFVDGFE